MNFQITEYCHHILEEYIEEGDICIDATAGNGGDTEFLCQKVGETGNVYAFDVQEEALNATEKRLDDAGIKNQIFEKNLSKLLTEPSVNLVLSGHEKLSEYVKEPIKAAIFNLGYLPKTDKSVVTKADTTLTALDALTNQLVVGGRIAIMIYYGHEGGMEEKNAVIKWTSSLPQKDWEVTSYAPLNQIHTPPILVLIEKRK